MGFWAEAHPPRASSFPSQTPAHSPPFLPPSEKYPLANITPYPTRIHHSRRHHPTHAHPPASSKPPRHSCIQTPEPHHPNRISIHLALPRGRLHEALCGSVEREEQYGEAIEGQDMCRGDVLGSCEDGDQRERVEGGNEEE